MGFLNHNKDVASRQEQERQKLVAAETTVKENLAQNPLLDALMESLVKEGSWVRTAQSYYDDRERIVRIERDSVAVTWCTYHTESYVDAAGKSRTKKVPDIHGQAAYSYTASGYVPLHSFSYDGGKKEIDLYRVFYFWTSLIQEHMEKEMPECKFDTVVVDRDTNSAYFTYKVPKLKFKDWF